MSTVNDNAYVSGNFSDPISYAAYFAQLLGDAFSHVYSRYSLNLTGAQTLGTGSFTFTILNLGTNLPNFGISASVRIVSSQDSMSWMQGNVTAISAGSITVNVSAFNAPVVTADTSWTLEYTGGFMFNPATPIAILSGGTNASDAPTARLNLGVGDPSAVAEIIFDDFIGGHGTFLWDRWRTFNQAGGTIGSAKSYAGDKSQQPNSTPLISGDSLFGSFGSGSYAGHPGVLALEGTVALDTAALRWGVPSGTGFFPMFVTAGELLDCMFMFPVAPVGETWAGEIGFNSNAVQVLSLYTSPVTTAGVTTLLFAPLVVDQTSATVAVPTGVLQAGVWYRASVYASSGTQFVIQVFTEAGVSVYNSGAITHNWDSTVMMIPRLQFKKLTGSTKSAMLVDYYYAKRLVSR